MTADRSRNRSSKFGPFGRRVSARRGGPESQADSQPESRPQSGLLADFGDHGATGYFPYESSNQANPDGRTSLEGRANAEGWTSLEAGTNAEGWTYREGWTSLEAETNAEGWTYREGWTSPEAETNAEGWTYREGATNPEGATSPQGHAGDRESGVGESTMILNAAQDAKRHTGRHGSHRAKTARKGKVRKILPAAMVVAAVAGGTAAYGLTSGGSHDARSNAAATLPGTLDALGAGTSSTNAAGTKLVKVATAKGTTAARPAAKPTPKPASPKPTTSSTAGSAASSTAESAASSQSDAPASTADAASSGSTTSNAPATTQAATPAATPTASQSAAATTVSCNLNAGGLLPQNVTAIVNFLLANGYSDNAAAGIAGNMYQESTGNPEAVGDGGGGLIGFTPLPSGYVTGNVTADLQTQLNAVLTYNQIWASYLPALNAATSPSDAADTYVTDFERAGIPATATREASAEDVASACGI